MSERERPDLLCTEGLIDSGVVDFVWNQGWRKATADSLRKAQHGWSDENPVTTLPKKAVLACFCVHFPDVCGDLRHNYSHGRYVIISRDGDPPLREDFPDCVHHVFGINVASGNPRVTPIPMVFHAFWGFGEEIANAMVKPRKKTNRVLVSYSIDMPGAKHSPAYDARFTAIEYFRDKPWATVNEKLLQWQTRTGYISTPYPWGDYLALLREHDYLVVPVGYGTERVAQWEAMVLGTIPICIRCPELLHFSDTPIAWVNDWSEVTPEWCDANIHLIEQRSLERLKLSHWVERVREKKAEL